MEIAAGSSILFGVYLLVDKYRTKQIQNETRAYFCEIPEICQKLPFLKHVARNELARLFETVLASHQALELLFSSHFFLVT